MPSKLAATSLSLGSGSSGGIFSPSLFMGATLGGAFGALLQLGFPAAGISVPAFAMVGMAAMVGGGTGAAMTAVTMIFEMTLDYSIVMPMIIAVAISIGCRRVLSAENIYTIKLLARRHFIPKALHANMFLVRQAADVMDKDILVLPDSMPFDDFLRLPEHAGRMRHVVVTHGDSIAGVLRINTALRRGLERHFTGVTLGRHREPGIHDRARAGHHVQRDRAHVAQEIDHGGRDVGRNRSAQVRHRRRHHQGACRRLGRREHQTLRGFECATLERAPTLLVRGPWVGNDIKFEPLTYRIAGEQLTETLAVCFPQPGQIHWHRTTQTASGIARYDLHGVRN